MTENEFFRTHEGRFRILVEQIIGDEVVDWHLVDRRTINTPDKLVAHTEAAKAFVGAAVNWTGERTETGFEFVIAK